jgi:hypothetical protein
LAAPNSQASATREAPAQAELRLPAPGLPRQPVHRSLRHTHAYGSKFSIDDLGVPLAKELEQLSSVAQRSNGIPLIRRPECIFQPVGDTWVCKDLFESHTYFYGMNFNEFRLGFSKPRQGRRRGRLEHHANKYPLGRSSLVPVSLHQLENITFGITEKYEPAAGDNGTKINHAIWFDAVPA